MAEPSHKRSQALQIYLKEGVAEEKVLLEVWEALKGLSGRKQNLFRDMLLAGFQAYLEADKIPEDVMLRCDLDRLLERKIRRKNRAASATRQDATLPAPVAAYPYPYAPPAYPIQQPMQATPYYHPQQPMPVEPAPIYQAPPQQVQVPHEAPTASVTAAPEHSTPPVREAHTPQAVDRSSNPKAAQDNQEAAKKKPRFDLM
jgi:FtsZ-interacting cell division protein ZipA